MNLQHLVTAAIRIVAIIAGLFWARDMTVLATLLAGEGGSQDYTPQFGVAAFWLVACMVLWKFSQPLSMAVTRFDKDEQTPAKTIASPRELEIALLLVMGIYLLFNVVSDLAYWLSTWFMYQRDHSRELRMEMNDIALFFATLVELLFAMLLIFRVQGIVAILRRLRS